MKRYPILVGLLICATVIPYAAAHGGHGHPDDEQNQSMMDDCLENTHCRTVSGMMGYGWVGIGAWGFLLGIAAWAFVILSIIYLFRKIAE